MAGRLAGSLFIAGCCLALFEFSAPTIAAELEEKELTFAVVPKFMHPFFERAHGGCKKAAAEHSGMKCKFIGPAKSGTDEQVQIVHDLISQGVSGIAVAPSNPAAMVSAFKRAREAGIPVTTFDADLIERDRPMRKAYIGSRNFDIGVALAQRLVELKPEGGTLAIQSGEPSADNLRERIEGVRSVLKDRNWREVPGTPVYCNDDDLLAVQQMEDLLGKYDKLDGFLSVGAWPQVPHSAYRRVAQKHQARIEGNELIIVVADTLEMQMSILKDGLSHGQIGQRPNEMGYRSVLILRDLIEGRSVPEFIYTGLDLCTPQNADSCVGGD
ncbi:MAG: ABC transporter substrate-binding protein [Proteobacteria bacterium]|nr:MAG: ABC transporter substrate-binding protein [Pseudomonadota bacterium]